MALARILWTSRLKLEKCWVLLKGQWWINTWGMFRFDELQAYSGWRILMLIFHDLIVLYKTDTGVTSRSSFSIRHIHAVQCLSEVLTTLCMSAKGNLSFRYINSLRFEVLLLLLLIRIYGETDLLILVTHWEWKLKIVRTVRETSLPQQILNDLVGRHCNAMARGPVMSPSPSDPSEVTYGRPVTTVQHQLMSKQDFPQARMCAALKSPAPSLTFFFTRYSAKSQKNHSLKSRLKTSPNYNMDPVPDFENRLTVRTVVRICIQISSCSRLILLENSINFNPMMLNTVSWSSNGSILKLLSQRPRHPSVISLRTILFLLQNIHLSYFTPWRRNRNARPHARSSAGCWKSQFMTFLPHFRGRTRGKTLRLYLRLSRYVQAF